MNTKEQNNQESEALSEEMYIATRQSYDSAELEVSGRYDKWILTLSGGALGLSITFIEKIAKDPFPSTIPVLAVSWGFLVLALLMGLISLVTSQSAIRECRAELDNANLEERAPHFPNKRWFAILTNSLNWGALVAFIIGVILLCTFSIKNINHKEKCMSDSKKTGQTFAQDGFVPSKPPVTNSGTKGFVPSTPPKTQQPKPPKSEK